MKPFCSLCRILPTPLIPILHTEFEFNKISRQIHIKPAFLLRPSLGKLPRRSRIPFSCPFARRPSTCPTFPEPERHTCKTFLLGTEPRLCILTACLSRRLGRPCPFTVKLPSFLSQMITFVVRRNLFSLPLTRTAPCKVSPAFPRLSSLSILFTRKCLLTSLKFLPMVSSTFSQTFSLTSITL